MIGAVHITQSHRAGWSRIAGYDMEIIDPRTAFATDERFPGVTLHADWPETVLAARPLDAYTAVAAVTHDPKIDDFALKAALDAGCFYVGALGSRKTHARRVERLDGSWGIGRQDRIIHAPIGLDIGASSPAEIAVAVHWAGDRCLPPTRARRCGKSARDIRSAAVGEAVGAILAHATQAGSRRIKKGTLLTREDVDALRDGWVSGRSLPCALLPRMWVRTRRRPVYRAAAHCRREPPGGATGRVNVRGMQLASFAFPAP